MGLSGHVWGKRFFSRIIQDLRELLMVHKYIDDNPAKAGQAKNRFCWRWGGLWHNRNGCRELIEPPPVWLQLASPEHGMLLLPYSHLYS
jgi:hypothetical protein